jgi:hypothetical protein
MKSLGIHYQIDLGQPTPIGKALTHQEITVSEGGNLRDRRGFDHSINFNQMHIKESPPPLSVGIKIRIN